MTTQLLFSYNDCLQCNSKNFSLITSYTSLAEIQTENAHIGVQLGFECKSVGEPVKTYTFFQGIKIHGSK